MTLNLLDIAIADRLGQYNPLQVAAIHELEELKEKALSLYEAEGRFTMKELAVNGNDLLQEFTLTPGPQIGLLLEKSFERVLENVAARNTKKKIFNYIRPSVNATS
ncbi:MAG: hypothetical protein Q8O99_00530 [bacterium]|nr:hypothetical protein [bacterium]